MTGDPPALSRFNRRMRARALKKARAQGIEQDS
jgi:hypothetical protein